MFRGEDIPFKDQHTIYKRVMSLVPLVSSQTFHSIQVFQRAYFNYNTVSKLGRSIVSLRSSD